MHYIFNNNFPDPEHTDEDGLLAIGGDLSPEMLLNAYSQGIFPWFNEDEPVLWWCPDPRLVLFPREVKLSKSMKQILRRGDFHFSVNRDFIKVIQHCRDLRVEDGTWISEEIIQAYTELHQMGFALSIEVWHKNELAGGLYGVQIGKMFFGESMFTLVPNASKAALIFLCLHCLKTGIELIDCQQSTAHLKSMGAREISRADFLERVKTLVESAS